MPRTLKIPGFTERVRARFAVRRPDGNISAFEETHHLPRGQLNRWLAGSIPKFEHLELLAKALDVPWEWLLVGDEGAKRAYDYAQHRPTAPTSLPPEREEQRRTTDQGRPASENLQRRRRAL